MTLPYWEVPRTPTLKDVYLPVSAVDRGYTAVVLRADAATLELTARLVVCRPISHTP